MQRLLMAVILLAFGAGAGAGALAQTAGESPRRWIYLQTNLSVPDNIAKAEQLLARGEAAGYNGLVLTDSKFSRLGQMPPDYFANVQRLKASAASHHIEIIPTLFPMGWSNDLLSADPNLAEGLPVKEALFVVRGDEATLREDPMVELKAGGFSPLRGWDWHDAPVSFDQVVNALRIDADGSNARISQKVRLTPFRQYHFSVRIKTSGFRGTPEAKFLARTSEGLKTLCFHDWEIKPTQDWQTYHHVFNSQDQTEVMVYLGAWEPKGGTAWFADAKFEEVGLLNVLRRPGAPVVVKREDGATLTEAVDYAPIKDPRMGNVPYAGEYEIYHQPPAIHLIKPLPEGARLRVSWYHPVTNVSGAVMICPSEPKTIELLKDQAQRVHQLFGAGSYFMAHDEIRTFNWCQACQDRHLDAGALLADNLRTCTKILRQTAPGATIYVWSDMFDPNHNARKNYYLVRGDLAGSWEGLAKDVVVVLWYFDKRAESMRFFSERGNRMLIAGYYDSDPLRIKQWLKAAARSSGVMGTMYTTWEHNYNDLEAFARAAKAQ